MKHILTFNQFLNESNRVNEGVNPADVKKVEMFLAKKGKYDKDKDIYVWDDGTLEFDVTLGVHQVKLYDGEETTLVDYSDFIKQWMS